MLHPTFPAALPAVKREEPTARIPNIDPIRTVDEAVRSVLRALRGGPARERSGAEVFPERLFSLRHVESLPGGTREIKIAPGTVVTPLARDALKRLGIGLRFVSKAEVDRVRRKGEWAFAIESESGIVSVLRRALLDDSEPWTELATATDLTRWLGEAEDRGAMLLTDEAAPAVWRACRVTGVRAAVSESGDAVDRAVRGLGVNLLVIEPQGKSIAFLRQLGLTYRRGGAPRAPEGLDAE